MNERLAGYAYDQEDAVTWLQPPDALRYVREALVLCRFRARQPHAAPDARLVAYATLRPDAPPARTHRFVRRVWYAVEATDERALERDIVVPASVQAGQVSVPVKSAGAPDATERESGAVAEAREAASGPEPEAPGLAFRVKRVSVPLDPAGAAAVLRRHFTPAELYELAAALTRHATVAEQRHSA